MAGVPGGSMPRRADLASVLVIGSGPIVIGQACEFDYSGTQACRVLKSEGLRVSLVNSNPATIMTDPEFADATYVEPITLDVLQKVIAIQQPDAVLPTLGGQTALNAAVALHEAGTLAEHGVELIGADIEAIKAGEDRERFKQIVTGLGAEVPASTICRTLAEAEATADRLGYPVVVRPSYTLGGSGSGVAYDAGGSAPDRRRRAGRQPGHRGAARGVDPRLEGVRARADARPARQRGRGLLDREHRPDGRAHRRLGHRGAGHDADRPRVPADARHRDRGGPGRRRGHRRLQHPVRRAPGHRPDGRDRDEPAGVAVLGAGLQGHRVPDRQDRGQAGHRLHARRNPQRHHRRDPGQLRAGPGLRGGQGAPVRVREVPRRRPGADHAHEVGGRGDGHRPQLPRGAAEGAALARTARRGTDLGRSARERPRPWSSGARSRTTAASAPSTRPCGPGPPWPSCRRPAASIPGSSTRSSS